jgi:tetratricopeptide (TPR) repeat protein
MQQYRVNYSLLIGLAVGTLVVSGAVFALWSYQIDRKAGFLLSEAQKNVEAKEYRRSQDFYRQYLAIRSDDHDARIKYAHAMVDTCDQEDATSEDFGNAQKVLEETLRSKKIAEMPESKKLRRRLIDLYGRETIRRWKDALDHIGILLQSDPNDPEIQALRAKFLVRNSKFDEARDYAFKLIGYDPKSETFDPKKATAPNDPEVYANLAQLLHGKEQNPELAEHVLEQLIAANPKSAKAYMSRGRLRLAWDDKEGGKADAEQAFRLAPDDKDVLMFMADLASEEKDYKKANEYVARGKKLHPNESQFYKKAAMVALEQNDSKQAVAEIDAGMKGLKGQKSLDLLIFKMAELQLRTGDTEGARKSLEQLKQVRNIRPEIIEYFDANILFTEEKWQDAMESFNKLRPRLSDAGREQVAEIDFKLGFCYEKLGTYELAREQYKLVLQQNPQYMPASAGLTRVNAMMGMDEKGDSVGDPFQLLIADILKKPKAEQDWSKVDAMLGELAKKMNWDDTLLKIQQAKLLTMREDYAGANRMLDEARKLSKENVDIYRLKVQLARLDPKIGPDKALVLWQQVADHFKDPRIQPELRLDKADILIAQRGKNAEDREKLKADLGALVTGIDDWAQPEKVRLWGGMAGRYLSLGMAEEARQYLRLAAVNRPSDLPLRLALFSLAFDANDDEGMEEAQNMILEIVRDKNDSAWLYAEARRKLSMVNRRKLGPEALNEVREHINQAMQQRKDWHELYALNAEVELMSGNTANALKMYDLAETRGRPTPLAVAKHIRLLAQIGRFNDAAKLLERIPETSRQAMLGPLYPEILFRTNQVEEALRQAKTATENDPENAQNHFWYSQLLARSAQSAGNDAAKRKTIMDQAIAEMKRATELQPEFPEAWLALVSYNAMQNNLDVAEKAMRDAQLVLSGDNLQMFLAKGYEALANVGGPNARWFDAETMYRAIYETAPDDLQRTQTLAAFYLGPVYQRPDRQIKATPLINKILRAGAEKKVPAGDANLLWARRMAAKLLALTGDYQNLRKAEDLLASNSKDGTLPIEDKLAMAEILAPRPEPRSRLAAIALLEEVSALQPLSEQAEIVLGELYYAVGKDWGKYREHMRKVTGLFPKSVQAKDAYIRKLIERGDERSIAEATQELQQLQKLAPSSMATFELTVRLADKIGKKAEVRTELVRRLPDLNKISQMNDDQLRSLEAFANLLVELEDLDTAEKIYRAIAASKPEKVYTLANFLGMHRDVAQCFEKLNEVYSPGHLPRILETAMAVVRAKRDQIGEKFDPEVQRWLDAGLRENPDSITLLIVQADLYDVQKKYAEAADVYTKLLKRDDLAGLRRAVVLNNLAYIVALAGNAAAQSDDPLKLVNEAAQIMGPNSDILDTRAVVYIADGQYQDAIDDLELAVTDGPTASKYFHKAQSHLGAKQNAAALEAWKKAEELGLNRDALNRMEHENFEKMKLEIEKLRGSSVTRNEPRRQAG